MKIREIMITQLMKTKLFELAFNRAETIKKVSDLQFQIAEHIVKVFMYHESSKVDHWCSELNTWFRKIQRLKLRGTNQPLSYDVLIQVLWEEPLESVEEVQDHMNEMVYDYPDLKIDQSDAVVIHKQVEDLLTSVCLAISRHKFQNIKDYL